MALSVYDDTPDCRVVLITAGVPVVVIVVLCNWYSKLSFTVRWNNAVSDPFGAGSGVRQGCCLSPAIFNVFINVLIVQLKKLNIVCRMSGIFVGCLLYADDIILLSPSVTGLQEMLKHLL